MEEQKQEAPVDIIAPSAEAPAPEAEKPQAPSESRVTITSSLGDGGDVTTKDVRFHTPTLLKEVEALKDGCHVDLTIADPGSNEPRNLLSGTKEEAIDKLKKSIVPPEHVATELRKFAQFLLDHSTLKAIGVHAICTADDGNDAGFGFVATAQDCTLANAVALVNCGDANIDEFISKSGIEVPGRGGTPGKGTVVTPTPEQVEKLG